MESIGKSIQQKEKMWRKEKSSMEMLLGYICKFQYKIVL
jgi:hypothetical protein